jgi:hypothetical protein
VKVLTLWQPWASLVALGVKTIETRSWSTKYRGPLAIHAAAKMPTFERRYVRGVICTRDAWHLWTVSGPGIHAPLPLGAIVATCTLVDVVPILGDGDSRHGIRSFLSDYPETSGPHAAGLWVIGFNEWNRGHPELVEAQRPYGDFTAGRYAWLLSDVVPVDPPVPFRGGQGLSRTWEPVEVQR